MKLKPLSSALRRSGNRWVILPSLNLPFNAFRLRSSAVQPTLSNCISASRPDDCPRSNGRPACRYLHAQDWTHAMHTPRAGDTPCFFGLQYLNRHTKKNRQSWISWTAETIRQFSNSKRMNLLALTPQQHFGNLRYAYVCERGSVQHQGSAHAQ